MKAQLFLILLLLLLLLGCDSFYPIANFHLINISKDKPITDIRMKFSGEVIYTEPLKRYKIAPGIQHMFSKSGSNGKYDIVIEADSGRIKESHPLSLGEDKWVIICYNFQKPVDSTTLIETLEFVDTCKFKGIVPQITVEAKNEPIK